MPKKITNKSAVRPTMALPSYYARRRRNMLLALFLLLLCLITIAALFISYFFLREEPLPSVEKKAADKISPPQFLFVIPGGPGDLALVKPLDVKISPKNGRVYVTSRYPKYGKGRVEVFTQDGVFLFAFDKVGGGKTLRNPTYLTINQQGKVYVNDSRLKKVFIFSEDGKYLSTFDPDGNPDFEWAPLGIAFDKAGNLYATDVLDEHQIIVFDSTGRLKLKFGNTRSANQKGEFKGQFYFPNGIFVDRDGKIFVADSNNRRVQAFSPKGKFLYIVETGGTPRGIWIDKKNRLYVSDALGHDVLVIRKNNKKGDPLCIFGEQGVEFAQFQYPNGLGLNKIENRIYVTDRENNRVQVWGWPVIQAVPAQARRGISVLALLIPPLLLLIWLLARRRRVYACNEFIEKIIDNHELEQLSNKHRRVFVAPETYESFKGYVEGDLEITDVIRPIKVKKEDIKNMQDSHGLNHELATIFARAKKGWKKPRIFSDQDDAHIVAQKLNVESMDHDLFVEHYNVKEEKRGKGTMKDKTKKKSK